MSKHMSDYEWKELQAKRQYAASQRKKEWVDVPEGMCPTGAKLYIAIKHNAPYDVKMELYRHKLGCQDCFNAIHEIKEE